MSIYVERTYKSIKKWYSTIEGDKYNMFIMQIQYTQQGIPMGQSAVIPQIQQERGVNYSGQAAFSLVTLPFSLKQLWAPQVDSYYNTKFGRRKSWQIPMQLLCGLLLYFIGPKIDIWIDNCTSTNSSYYTTLVSGYFIILYMLMATQDIATDAWSLTLLTQQNIEYAAIINNIGQYIGIYCTYVLYLQLNSTTTCNNYFRINSKPYPIADLTTFMRGCGILFLFITIWIMIFVSEDGSRVSAPWQLYNRKDYNAIEPLDISGDDDEGNYDNDNNNNTIYTDNNENEYSISTQSSVISVDELIDITSQEKGINKNIRRSSIIGDTDSIRQSSFIIDTNNINQSSIIDDTNNTYRSSVCDDTNSICQPNIVNDTNNIHRPSTTDNNILRKRKYKDTNKKEKIIDIDNINKDDDSNTPTSLKDTLLSIKKTLKEPQVQLMCQYQQTSKLGTAPSDSVSQLKLLDNGLTKTDTALIASLTSPILLLTPIIVPTIISTKYYFLLSFICVPQRTIQTILYSNFILYSINITNHKILFNMLLFWNILLSFVGTIQSVTTMSLFTKMADPKIGGTFITLLNTCSNLGSSSTRLLSFYFLEYFSYYTCIIPSTNLYKLSLVNINTINIIDTIRIRMQVIINNIWNIIRPNTTQKYQLNSFVLGEEFQKTISLNTLLHCNENSHIHQDICNSAGGTCKNIIDGYYIEVIVFGIIQIVWILYLYYRMRHLCFKDLSVCV